MRRILLAALLAACGPALVEPVAPERITPGPAQERAAEYVSGCAGVAIGANDVRWWVADAIDGRPDALGAWNPPRDIYLVRAIMGSEAEWVVSAHELLHHVLDGDAHHKDRRWASCGLLEDGMVLANAR